MADARATRAFAVAAGVGEAAPGDVDAAGAAVAAQHREVVAGAAAAVEDEGIAAAARRPFEQRLDEATEPVEPEVVLLGARRSFEQSVHESVCERIDGACRWTASDILLRGDDGDDSELSNWRRGVADLRAGGWRVRKEATSSDACRRLHRREAGNDATAAAGPGTADSAGTKA